MCTRVESPTVSAQTNLEQLLIDETLLPFPDVAEKLGVPMDPALAIPGAAVDSLPDWRGAPIRNDRVWQAALWLIAAGDPATAQRFLLHKGETAEAEDIARMARLMLELGRPWDGLRLAKQAAGKGGVFPAAYYPLTGLETHELGLPAELVLAIARQESEFNHAARSHVGARGLMQLMPGTARDLGYPGGRHRPPPPVRRAWGRPGRARGAARRTRGAARGRPPRRGGPAARGPSSAAARRGR